MKTAMLTIGGVVSVLSLAALTTNVGAQRTSVDVPIIGMIYVELTSQYIDRSGAWLRAFIPSGSTDRRVLVSINEHWVPNDRVDYVAAHTRTSDVLGPGVEINALLNSGGQFPRDARLHVTVMQPGAKFGEPRPVDKPIVE